MKKAFWNEREFYKTDDELRDELAMGYKEFKNAKSKLKKLKLITTTRRGVPCRTFYRLEESALLAQIPRWAERDQLFQIIHRDYNRER